jgi:hypothetical protein
MIDTLEIADELSQDGMSTREQAERLARLSSKAARATLATRADLEVVKTELKLAISETASGQIRWFAGVMIVHAVSVIAVSVALVKLL